VSGGGGGVEQTGPWQETERSLEGRGQGLGSGSLERGNRNRGLVRDKAD
jgi:hypothetical protein